MNMPARLKTKGKGNKVLGPDRAPGAIKASPKRPQKTCSPHVTRHYPWRCAIKAHTDPTFLVHMSCLLKRNQPTIPAQTTASRSRRTRSLSSPLRAGAAVAAADVAQVSQQTAAQLPKQPKGPFIHPLLIPFPRRFQFANGSSLRLANTSGFFFSECDEDIALDKA